MRALRQRFGSRRLPVVTAAVSLVTATTSVLGLAICGLAGALTVALLVGAPWCRGWSRWCCCAGAGRC